jgi:hypothetical protein
VDVDVLSDQAWAEHQTGHWAADSEPHRQAEQLLPLAPILAPGRANLARYVKRSARKDYWRGHREERAEKCPGGRFGLGRVRLAGLLVARWLMV